MPHPIVTTFPARLAELRTARGWTQPELARRAGTAVTSISKLERGERSPSLELACRLAAALGVDLNSLSVPAADTTPAERGRPQKKNPKK